MMYKKDEDNRYRVSFMVATEELMDRLTVVEFIDYLKENAEFEDDDAIYLDNRVVDVKVYDLKETDKLHKEFLITEDGRVFYWRTLLEKIELVDREPEKKEEDKGMFKVFIESAGGVKRDFTEFETEAEAERFCGEYGWEWMDENGFVWDMNYEEVKGMTEEQVKELKVGDLIINILGDVMEVVSINGLMYELKWVQEDGNLSAGSEYMVSSHFKYCRKVDEREFVVEYYLPNQSRLFSDPQRVSVKGEENLKNTLGVSKRYGYDVLAVYEVVSGVPRVCGSVNWEEMIR